MSEKKQNLNFVTPNKDQQKIFQDYLGKKLGTKALLVLEQEIEDKQTSYNFIYQYPDQLQLASFLIVLDSDERLVSLASNIVTDASSAYAINIQDFILEYVKKTLGKDTKELFETPYKNLEQNIPNTEKQLVKTVVDTVLEVLGKREILEQIVRPKTSEISAGEAEDYSTKSQATYFFDCKNEGNYKKDKNGNIVTPVQIDNINSITSKGSFCCILQRLKYKEIEVTENGKKVKKLKEIDNPENIIPFDQEKSNELCYYILTAGHNLQNFLKEDINNITGPEAIKKYLGNKSKYAEQLKYKLIKDANNFVELELITDYRNTYDAAILKINKITEGGKIKYCDKVYIRQIAENSKKYYYKEKTNEFYDIETRKKIEGNDSDFKLTTEEFSVIDNTSFYINTIKFNNLFFNPDSRANTERMEFIGYISKYKNNSYLIFKGQRRHQDSEIEPKNTVYYATTKIGDTGDSGGLMFSNKTIQGIYIGNNKVGSEESGICRSIDSLNFDKEYKIC